MVDSALGKLKRRNSMADAEVGGILFNAERSVITKHINNILKTKELERDLVCARIAHTAEDGKTNQSLFYNLNMILSVGYRINSKLEELISGK